MGAQLSSPTRRSGIVIRPQGLRCLPYGLPGIRWQTAYAIAPPASPTSPPRIDAGIPSSKIANHAVGGWTRRPTTSPTTPPNRPAETAPIAAHLKGSGLARSGTSAIARWYFAARWAGPPHRGRSGDQGNSREPTLDQTAHNPTARTCCKIEAGLGGAPPTPSPCKCDAVRGHLLAGVALPETRRSVTAADRQAGQDCYAGVTRLNWATAARQNRSRGATARHSGMCDQVTVRVCRVRPLRAWSGRALGPR